MMSLFCWHNWDKWSSPTNGIYGHADSGIGYFAVSQMRVCKKCGLAQVKRLPKLRSLAELKEEK